MMMKKLCRIRLINWHYFVNETIKINGSFLISGENTSGKSTILDAIQLVLTTNTRKFNTAANEKSNRDLKGYVRCKTGSEDSTYSRKGSVITYVALEFYEEKTAKYFTLGVKIDSPDEESKLTTKWFREECKLEDLSFLTGDRPSTTEEFRRNDKKVKLISQLSEAKLRFGQRLGNLEDRFFDMIPKSLAFKPMDNVKDFINKFILSEKAIEVSSLRNNITALKEFENLMDVTKEKIKELDIILLKNNDIIAKDRDIKSNEILINKAELETKKQEYEELKKSKHILEQKIISEQKVEKSLKEILENDRERLTNLKIALEQNETIQLIKDIKHRIQMIKKDEENEDLNVKKLQNMLDKVVDTLTLLNKHEIFIMTKDEIIKVGSQDIDEENKLETIYKLEREFKKLYEEYSSNYVRIKDLLDLYTTKKIKLEKKIKNLKNKKLTYPENTMKLKIAIEKEFLKQGIHSDIRIFSDLLEVTDNKWQNAVEGYLNSQRFYIIVEPRYYSIALTVYNKIKREVHTVGLVNTGKLDIHATVDKDSLAYILKSENRYAKAYAIYLLNRVIRCDDINQLKDHKIAITSECMLYQNFAVRKIDESVYRNPFIGAHAYEIQLKNKETELKILNEEIKTAENKGHIYDEIIKNIDQCKMEILEENMSAPKSLKEYKELISKERMELKKAEDNPNYIQMQIQIEECKKDVEKKEREHIASVKKITELEQTLEMNNSKIDKIKNTISDLENKFDILCSEDTEITMLGINKFDEQIKIKSPATIVQNFSPLKVRLENKKKDFYIDLIKLQSNYCSKYDCDLGTGNEQMDEYRKEHHKLIASDIIKYEEELKKTKETCELEFRESFLARLKENIENAKSEFKYLNSALKDIYYGEDNYKFEITYNKSKKSIYQMITSKDNREGFTLFSNSFEEEYKEEMEDLFVKLTAYDDKGEKVVAEYTDYRSYLDYDIVVEKKDGMVQRFSKIYGEKSGGETQTPYYVAIAASFVQLYKLGDTIRIIMLDEAFDKMDDNRISSMMDFFNSQNFQIILATPPSKMEVIGEKVDTILIAMREGSTSIVEEYDL